MRTTRHPTVVADTVTCCVCLTRHPAGDTMWWDIERSTFTCDTCHQRPDLVPVHHHQPDSPLAGLGLVDAMAITDRTSPDRRHRLDALYVAPTGIWVLATPAGRVFTRGRRGRGLRIDAELAPDPFGGVCADIAARHPRVPIHRVVVAPDDDAVPTGPIVAELGRTRATITGPGGIVVLIARTGPLGRHQASRILRDLAEAFPPDPDTPAPVDPSRPRPGFFATREAPETPDNQPATADRPGITFPVDRPQPTTPAASIKLDPAPRPTPTPVVLTLPAVAEAAQPAPQRPGALLFAPAPTSAPTAEPTFQAAPSSAGRPLWQDLALACAGVEAVLAPIWALGFWRGWF